MTSMRRWRNHSVAYTQHRAAGKGTRSFSALRYLTMEPICEPAIAWHMSSQLTMAACVVCLSTASSTLPE